MLSAKLLNVVVSNHFAKLNIVNVLGVGKRVAKTVSVEVAKIRSRMPKVDFLTKMCNKPMLLYHQITCKILLDNHQQVVVAKNQDAPRNIANAFKTGKNAGLPVLALIAKMAVQSLNRSV